MLFAFGLSILLLRFLKICVASELVFNVLVVGYVFMVLLPEYVLGVCVPVVFCYGRL